MDISSYKELSGESLQAATNDFVGQKISDYKEPTDALTKNTQIFIQALNDENETLINQYVSKLNLAACRYPGLDNVAIYVPKDKGDFPVTIFWRFGPTDNLILESPHEGRDGVQRVVCDLFLNTKAKCLIRNAVHPASAEGTKASGQNKRRTSDAAHSYTGLFTDVHKKLFNMYGVDAVYLQVHGMGSKRLMYLTNQKGTQFNEKLRSFPMSLARQFTKVFTMDQCNNITLGSHRVPGQQDGKPYTINDFKQGAAWFPTHSPCPNTCIQARVVNGGGATNTGKTDRGAFLHLESGPKLRGSDALGQMLRDKLCTSVNMAMNDWNNSPLPRPALPFKPSNIITPIVATPSTARMTLARAELSDAELEQYESDLRKEYPQDYAVYDSKENGEFDDDNEHGDLDEDVTITRALTFSKPENTKHNEKDDKNDDKSTNKNKNKLKV